MPMVKILQGKGTTFEKNDHARGSLRKCGDLPLLRTFYSKHWDGARFDKEELIALLTWQQTQRSAFTSCNDQKKLDCVTL